MVLRNQNRFLAFLVIASLALDLVLKDSRDRSEVLWACYWATSLIGVGLLFSKPSLVGAGFLFDMAVGVPSWTLGMLYTGRVYPTSIVLHIIPAAVAAFYLWHMQRFPRGATSLACLIFPVATMTSMLWSDPRLNVNFAQRPWGPLDQNGYPLAKFQLLLMILAVVLIWTLRTAIEIVHLWQESQGQKRFVKVVEITAGRGRARAA